MSENFESEVTNSDNGGKNEKDVSRIKNVSNDISYWTQFLAKFDHDLGDESQEPASESSNITKPSKLAKLSTSQEERLLLKEKELFNEILKENNDKVASKYPVNKNDKFTVTNNTQRTPNTSPSPIRVKSAEQINSSPICAATTQLNGAALDGLRSSPTLLVNAKGDLPKSPAMQSETTANVFPSNINSLLNKTNDNKSQINAEVTRKLSSPDENNRPIVNNSPIGPIVQQGASLYPNTTINTLSNKSVNVITNQIQMSNNSQKVTTPSTIANTKYQSCASKPPIPKSYPNDERGIQKASNSSYGTNDAVDVSKTNQVAGMNQARHNNASVALNQQISNSNQLGTGGQWGQQHFMGSKVTSPIPTNIKKEIPPDAFIKQSSKEQQNNLGKDIRQTPSQTYRNVNGQFNMVPNNVNQSYAYNGQLYSSGWTSKIQVVNADNYGQNNNINNQPPNYWTSQRKPQQTFNASTAPVSYQNKNFNSCPSNTSPKPSFNNASTLNVKPNVGTPNNFTGTNGFQLDTKPNVDKIQSSQIFQQSVKPALYLEKDLKFNVNKEEGLDQKPINEKMKSLEEENKKLKEMHNSLKDAYQKLCVEAKENLQHALDQVKLYETKKVENGNVNHYEEKYKHLLDQSMKQSSEIYNLKSMNKRLVDTNEKCMLEVNKCRNELELAAKNKDDKVIQHDNKEAEKYKVLCQVNQKQLAKISEMKLVLDRLNFENQKLTTQISQKESNDESIKKLESTIQTLEDTKSANRLHLMAKASKIEKLEDTITEKNKLFDESAEKFKEILNENLSLRSEVDTHKEKIASLSKDNSDLLATCKDKLQYALSTVKKHMDETSKQKDIIMTLTKKNDQINKHNKSLKEKLNLSMKKVKLFGSNLKESSETINSLCDENTKLNEIKDKIVADVINHMNDGTLSFEIMDEIKELAKSHENTSPSIQAKNNFFDYLPESDIDAPEFNDMIEDDLNDENEVNNNEETQSENTTNVTSSFEGAKCKICDIVFRSTKKVVFHFVGHTGIKIFHCSECDFKFDKLDKRIENHFSSHNTKSISECRVLIDKKEKLKLKRAFKKVNVYHGKKKFNKFFRLSKKYLRKKGLLKLKKDVQLKSTKNSTEASDILINPETITDLWLNGVILKSINAPENSIAKDRCKTVEELEPPVIEHKNFNDVISDDDDEISIVNEVTKHDSNTRVDLKDASSSSPLIQTGTRNILEPTNMEVQN